MGQPNPTPKRILALPDLEHVKPAVLNSLTSASGQRTYDHAIREFGTWLERAREVIPSQKPGGVVGGSWSFGSAGSVVTKSGSLGSDQLPAESRALTLKV